jgi:hypothetical protein
MRFTCRSWRESGAEVHAILQYWWRAGNGRRCRATYRRGQRPTATTGDRMAPGLPFVISSGAGYVSSKTILPNPQRRSLITEAKQLGQHVVKLLFGPNSSKTPSLLIEVRAFLKRNLASSYFDKGQPPHYLRRCCVSRLSSGWVSVGPQRQRHQERFNCCKFLEELNVRELFWLCTQPCLIHRVNL